MTWGKTKANLVCFCILLKTLQGYASEPENKMLEVNFYQAAQLVANQQAQIIDVRQLTEWQASGVIKGAYLIEMSNLLTVLKERPSILPDKLKDKNRHWVIICRSGKRSAVVAKVLVAMGYKHVYNVSGGILNWVASGGGLVSYTHKSVSMFEPSI